MFEKPRWRILNFINHFELHQMPMVQAGYENRARLDTEEVKSLILAILTLILMGWTYFKLVDPNEWPKLSVFVALFIGFTVLNGLMMIAATLWIFIQARIELKIFREIAKDHPYFKQPISKEVEL